MLFVGIVAVIPVLFFVVCEWALRVGEYGPNVSLFSRQMIAGKEYFIMNNEVKNRYFHTVDFNPTTSPDFFPIVKPENTFRIFCLGGSTTVGYPYGYAGSFSSFLRDRLHTIFPDKHIEIINLGMTATNSFTALDIARELPDYSPDLILVYDGHNEFYGALGVASRESITGSRALTFLSLRLMRFKTYLALRDAMRWARGVFSSSSAEGESGTMMERLAKGQYVPLYSEMYQSGLQTFQANVSALKECCEANKIPLILSTQVSNLRDQPPFVSTPLTELPQDQRSAFNACFNKGLSYWMNGQPDSSALMFQRALAFDTLHAEARYRLAQSLDSSGNTSLALRAYVQARDCDQLRFRTASEFNAMLLSMSNGVSTFVVDMESVFTAHSRDGLIGNDLLLEHLHPNARGYFLMAKAYASVMRSAHLIAPESAWISRDTTHDDRLWNGRPITSLDEWCAQRRTALLTSGWPFKPETAQAPPIDRANQLATIGEEIVTGKKTWEEGHVAAAQYYASIGKITEAEHEYRSLINQFPYNVSAFLLLGQLYMKEGRLEEARVVLTSSLMAERTYFGYRALGGIALEQSKPDSAATLLTHALPLASSIAERSETGYLLAVAYQRKGDNARARTAVENVLRINPQFKPAQNLLRKLGNTQ